jgi:hypothetical protein
MSITDTQVQEVTSSPGIRLNSSSSWSTEQDGVACHRPETHLVLKPPGTDTVIACCHSCASLGISQNQPWPLFHLLRVILMGVRGLWWCLLIWSHLSCQTPPEQQAGRNFVLQRRHAQIKPKGMGSVKQTSSYRGFPVNNSTEICYIIRII